MKDTFKNYNQLFNQRKFEEAEKELKKILDRYGETINICTSFGWLYDQWAIGEQDKIIRQKRQKLSEKYFNLALKNDKNAREAVRGLATVLMHQEKYKEALEYYQKAHKIEKTFDSYNDLGNLYQKMGELKKAFEYYNKSLSLKKNKEESAVPLFNLIMISKSLKNNREGEYAKVLEKLAKKSPFAQMLFERLQKINV